MERDYKLCVAVLDTMYGECYGLAPRYFQINPRNKSGQRLYSLVNGLYHVYVTNACRELVTRADEHGTPDVEWLRENLERLYPIDLLLVCGSVAQDTYALTGLKKGKNILHVLKMPHPAWRGWTALKLEAIKEEIRMVHRGQIKKRKQT